ncbi:MAG: beta-lactamase family protein [Thermoanaerobaculia bacterium]|nr:beta-lactamase family protein [Thermoanaerobaculia bacterium]
MRFRTLLWLALLAILASCTRDQAPAPLTLDELRARASQVEGLESLAIWHRGSVLLEIYLEGDADDLRDVRSVTKSLTSVLVGIAIDQELLPSAEQPLALTLGRHGLPASALSSEIRLRHLLTMSAGLDWDDREDISLYQAWRASSNPVHFYLDRPATSAPGEDFVYASPAPHVLGAVIEEASGVSLPDFAQSHLFSALGISEVSWQALDDRQTNAGGALRIRTMDLLRIGRLVLDNGRWQDRDIVSRDWIAESTRMHIRLRDDFGYGYLWWISDGPPVRVVMGQGFGGQSLVVVPEWQLVAVSTSRWRRISQHTAEQQARSVQTFFLQDLAPLIAGLEGMSSASGTATSGD